MSRALVLVLDSVGIGGAPDAALYGDAGADTVGHIAECAARGEADRQSLRFGPLLVPNLARLGLGQACALATGRIPPGLENDIPHACYGAGQEISRGKDSPSGHWELAGAPVPFDWGYFPNRRPCFPAALIDALCAEAELPGILGDCHASGTAIIAELGEEHLRTGKPICYTSADSVFQIATHEEAFGLDRLYDVCAIARRLVDPLRIGRVIARHFISASSADYKRTANRRDYAVPPPAPTILDIATDAGRDVVSIGKIDDIFAHSGTGRTLKAASNMGLFDRTLDGFAALADGGLLFANFIEFDSEFGHRRDVAGYAAALEACDTRLPELIDGLARGDLLIITADHGCDPTWQGTDHTRERVPILALGLDRDPGSLGIRATFADVGATVASHLELPPPGAGTPF